MEVYKGTFFLPDKPDQEINGILSTTENSKFTLELLGGFSDPFSTSSEVNNKSITIWGNLYNGKKISLIECFRLNSKTVFGISYSETYRARLTMFGTHVSDRSQPHFNEINADIELLGHWLGVAGGNLQIEFGDRSPRAVKYTYNQPQEINFKISSELAGSFFFRQSFPLSERYKFELIQKTLVNISSSSAKSVDELIIAIRRFRKLLSFFIGRKVRVLNLLLTSYNEITQQIYKNGELIPVYETVELHYHDPEPFADTTEVPHEFFVKYDDIAADFSQIVQRWFNEVEEKILPISNILLQSLVNRSAFDDTDLVSIFQGVEAFHRRCVQNTVDLKHKHATFLKEKLNLVHDDEFKNWLKTRLGYAYEPTAKERLQALLDEHKQLLYSDLDEGTIKLWVKEIVNSRNYLTHYDPTSAKKCVTMQKLYDYTEMLKALLAISILEFIGIDKNHLKLIKKPYASSIRRLVKNP